jgi:hypothetical protein
MNSKRARMILVAFASLFVAGQSFIGLREAEGQSAGSPFVQVQGLDYEKRDKLYEGMTLDTEGWQAGTVVSKEPYAVVTKADADGVHVRIWTGVLVREQNDLLTYWDEIQTDAKGKVVIHATELGVTVRDYFAAASQNAYRTKAYAGKVPWADIPTDAEAAASGSAKVPSGSAVNLYGIVFADPNRSVASSPGPVKKETDIPDSLSTLAKFKETVVTELPEDVKGHWAQEEIADLMKKSILSGYEDHTIRPDRTLSRAEFVTLLVKALGLSAPQAEANGYADLKGHWSGPMIAAAQQSGLLDSNPLTLRFEPDSPMPRMEMAELLHRALQKYGANAAPAALSFNDIGSITETDKAALQDVVGAGIVGGYPDGSFRPEGSLTRAEAFKVVSKLIRIL